MNKYGALGKLFSEKILPEMKLNADEQLTMLREYLSTSEPFRHCRGKLGGDWLGIGILADPQLNAPEKPFSPTKVLDTLKWRTGQARVLINYLAKLRRDGHDVAYQELRFALAEERFVITGEELPLDKRQPGALLMYQPKRTLDLIRWLQLLNPIAIDNHLGKLTYPYDIKLLEDGIEKPRMSLKWLTEKVMADNPSIQEGLEKFYDSGMRNHRGNFLPSSIVWGEGNKSDSWISPTKGSSAVLCDPLWLRVANRGLSGSSGDILGNWGVACFFPGKTQAEILGAIPRDRQSEVAVWQFNYPLFVNNPTHGYSIGLFPESEHETFRKSLPTYTSSTITNGFGAVILGQRGPSDRAEHPMFDYRLHRHSSEEPDFDKVAMKLHFTWR